MAAATSSRLPTSSVAMIRGTVAVGASVSLRRAQANSSARDRVRMTLATRPTADSTSCAAWEPSEAGETTATTSGGAPGGASGAAVIRSAPARTTAAA